MTESIVADIRLAKIAEQLRALGTPEHCVQTHIRELARVEASKREREQAAQQAGRRRYAMFARAPRGVEG